MQERHGDRGLDLSAHASVDLYRRNAFRLSGLPVDASLRQLRRRSQEIEAAARLGDEGLITGDPLYPVRPQPPAEEVLTALQRIRDPNQRLLDEWFWLWPIPDLDVDGTNAEEVRRAWNELAGSGREHAASDADLLRQRIGELQEHVVRMLDRGPALQTMIFGELSHLTDRMRSRAQAERLVAEGHKAIDRGELERLRTINMQLQGLLDDPGASGGPRSPWSGVND